MTHLDLFSGIGGFALAARWAGIETVAFCEIDPFCRTILNKNWPGVLKYLDIKDLVHPDQVDIITAGFPCQPFSIAGSKKGKDDDRYLWPEVMRIIKKSKPTWFIGENVPGIIPYLDDILEDLEQEGYYWRAFLIPASLVGAPHKRERLWIIAHADSIQRQERTKNQETITERSQWSKSLGEIKSCCDAQFNWKENKPPISGVDDGVPNLVDRNKALGNAIVPQIPFIFMSLIKYIES